jgi:YetA-like protein
MTMPTMTLRVRLGLVAVALLVTPFLEAQTPKSVALAVKETTGIRRYRYPVGVRVPFPKGALSSADNARLTLNGAEVPGQFTSESLWPDGSVQWLAVDLNAEIGPNEEQKYQLEYGVDVKSGPPSRGLLVTENADSIQVGNVRFSRTGSPLLVSVKYRNEVLRAPGTGFAVVDGAGKLLDLKSTEPVKLEILKRGPIYVTLRYSGRLALDEGSSVPFVVTAEMPNSKAWVKVTAQVDDPGKKLKGILYQMPFSLGPFPWVWDFGTDRWTYGSLRNASDSMILTETVKTPESSDWQVKFGPKGQEQSYETAPKGRSSRLVRWGHIQDSKDVIAFGVDANPSLPGQYEFALDGEGHGSIRFTSATPAAQQRLTVYHHFVSTPVQIGAVTSASAMLSPLVATCDPKQFVISGVRQPK